MLVNRWALCEPFKATSTQQVQAYLKYMKYRIPVDRKTRRPTTGKDAISTIIRQHPEDRLLPLVLEARGLKKAEGYLDDTRLGRDGKFHPTFTTKPDTGRLASVNPNFQNQPNHGVDNELALAIRRTIMPSPGMLLLELDWKAIEAVLTGWFAGDEGFMKLSMSDSHSYLAWAILFHKGIVKDIPPEMTNPELGAILKTFRMEWEDYKLLPGKPEGIRFLAKKCNLGGSYGLQAKHQADILGCSVSDARELIEIRKVMAPMVTAWQEATQRLAHRQGFLENPFGYRRAVFNVFTKDKNGVWRQGEEANKALAFLPQSTAAGMLRETLLRVHNLPGCGEVFFPLVPIHDALLLEVREAYVAEVREQIRAIMERPWEELGGLSIKVDAKVGQNWGMEED